MINNDLHEIQNSTLFVRNWNFIQLFLEYEFEEYLKFSKKLMIPFSGDSLLATKSGA